VVIAVLIAVPVYMLFLRGDGDDKAPSDSALLEATTDPDKAAQVLLHQIGDPQQGITLRYPSGWTPQTEAGVVRVTSDDGTVIAVTSQGSASQAPAVFHEAVHGVSLGYVKPKQVTLVPAKKQPPIAGLPSAGAVVTGQLKTGGQRTTIVSVARGTRHAYVVSVSVLPDGGQLEAANLIVERGLTLSG
jgi:hypothetical protein